MFQKGKALLIVILAILIVFFLISWPTNKSGEIFIEINNIKIKTEVVSTVPSQRQGLSNRQNLDENAGMLFVFPDYKIRTFWMKDMKFSIDIIWILNNKIIDITKNAPMPSGETIPTFESTESINYVLEVNAGFSEKNSIKIGDMVKFSL